MGDLVIRVGIAGLSEGNGHPFSFSAIVNGYDRDAFVRADWPFILSYLETQPSEAFGFPGVRVTHAWTQDPDLTARLCLACRVDHPVRRLEEMLGQVDALIVARDDWDSHAAMALPFLSRGVPVFVDKPLTLDAEEMMLFRPYLETGCLMSTSGLRFAREVADLSLQLPQLGRLCLVAATVVNDIERYGVHMLDAAAGLGLPAPIAVTRLHSHHESFHLQLDGGASMHLDCLGEVGRTFHIALFGAAGHTQVDICDNFTAFRRTLEKFFEMCRTRVPPIPPQQTIRTMQLIAAAKDLAQGETAGLGYV